MTSKDKIKTSFLNVKQHINLLESRISALEDKLNKVLSILEKTPKTKEFIEEKPNSHLNLEKNDESSSGNKGVYSFNHSLFNHSTNNHSFNIQSLKHQLGEKIESLTHKELMVFLTIYQLDEELGRKVNYDDLSTRINLSKGCIRGYISNIIKKGLPLIKSKLNNKLVTLSIHSDFKDLNLKQRLTNLYYQQDPSQTRLN